MAGRTIYAADLFCGAGGTSTGLARAALRLGATVDLLAVNHWSLAVETHAAAHPWARHLCARIDQVDTKKAFPGGRLDLLVASPECTHHSIARGGKPVNDQSRASGWDVLRWVEELRPTEILVENVKEWRSWGPIGTNGKPLKSRRGETFAAWVKAVKSLGYLVEWRVLNAADYGAATTRERLFVRAHRGRGGVDWPVPSHAAPGEGSMFPSLPWRTAREVIDWKLEGRSAFARKKPLAATTRARIVEGLCRFGGDAAEPFVALFRHGCALPADLVEAGASEAVATPPPFVLPQNSSNGPRSVEKPLGVLTTTSRGVGVVEPYLVHLRGTGEAQVRGSAKTVDDPLPALTAGGGHAALVEPFVVTPGGPDLRNGRSVDAPLPTVTCKDRLAVVQPFILPHRQFDGAQVDSVDHPLRTITAKNGGDTQLVEPFVVAYYGTSTPHAVTEPVPTVTAKDRFGLVEPVRFDIRFRMLQLHELAAAMGFPPEYPFSGNKTDGVRQVGNAVEINQAEALCHAALAKVCA